MNDECNPNADEMNDEPNSRQQPLVGYTKIKVQNAEDHALYALKFLDEIIYHRITTEEIIRNAAIGIAEVHKVIDELKNAKLAGMKNKTEDTK
jgi:transcription initiation factor IIE alpha subunit